MAEPGTPPRGVTRTGRLRALLLGVLLPLLALLGLHMLSLHLGPLNMPQVMRLVDGQWLEDRQGDPPLLPGQAMPEKAEAMQLPDLRVEGSEPGWYLLDFKLAEAVHEPWLVAFTHSPELNLYLDGKLLARSQQGLELEPMYRGLRLGSSGVLINVPPAMLEAGEHRLALHLGATGEQMGTMSVVQMGPATQMRQLQKARDFWQTARLLTALSAALLGLFLLLVWLALRQEWVYGITGVYALSAALLLLPYLSVAPVPLPWWRMILDAADILARGLMLLLVVQWFAPGDSWGRRLALGFMAVALPLDLWAAYTGSSWGAFENLWPWWALGSRGIVMVGAWGVVLRAAVRSGLASHSLAAASLGLAFFCWAYVGYFALIDEGTFPLVDINVAGYAAVVGMAGYVLQRRFVSSLRAQARSRQALEEALAARSRELEARYQDLQRSEQLRVAAQERERLLQEMHDGLGSQLLMAKLGARQGMDTDTLVALLDDCIAEMRLTIDAMTVDDGDLGLLLANVRHRLQDRLRSAGLQLEWQLQDTPHLPRLMGAQGRDLVRIVQEALSNVLHHAQASRVRFATRVVDDGGTVLLSIGDDGKGLRRHAREGQGLKGMRKRAERIGAQISWREVDPGSERPGCEVQLRIPVAPRATAAPAEGDPADRRT